MFRMTRLGMLLLVIFFGGRSISQADLFYGLVYIIYDDGLGNCLYMVDVDVGNPSCTEFSPAFAWDSATPGVAVPWVDCRGDFMLSSRPAPVVSREPRKALTRGLGKKLPANANAALIKSHIPTSMKWQNGPQLWNPRDTATVIFHGRVTINLASIQSPSLREVALFQLIPHIDQEGVTVDRAIVDDMGNRRPISSEDAAFNKLGRFFALEIESNGTPLTVEKAIPAKSLEVKGEFKHQYLFEYGEAKVPAMLTK